MEIKLTTMNGRVPVQIMRMHGDLDSSTYEAFEAKASGLIKSGAQYIYTSQFVDKKTVV